MLGRLALALALGTAGGALFAWFRLPLAWMIGSMLFTTAAAMAGLPVAVPAALRTAMVMVLGIMLGSAFTPEIVGHLDEWAVTLLGLAAYIAVATVAGILFLRRVARLDPVTAFFTATPGGLNEMVLMGGQMGGDDRTISLVHALRVMLVVLLVPFAFQWLGLYDPARRGALGPPLTGLAPVDLALLASCVVGYPLARRLGIPAAQIVGPMLLSAAIHLSGLTAGHPPGPVVAAAQVVVGAALGSRFAGLSLARVGRCAVLSLGLTAVMLGVTVAASWLLSWATGLDLAGIILAYAPGGLAEMSLVALALGTDVAFVSTHHIVRIVLIVTLAPSAFLLWRRRAAGRAASPAATPAGDDD